MIYVSSLVIGSILGGSAFLQANRGGWRFVLAGAAIILAGFAGFTAALALSGQGIGRFTHSLAAPLCATVVFFGIYTLIGSLVGKALKRFSTPVRIGGGVFLFTNLAIWIGHFSGVFK